MRVVHLAFSDIGGGASRGSYALHQALVELGVDSWMIVDDRQTTDPRVLGDDSRSSRWLRRARRRIDGAVLKPYRGRDPSLFSPNLGPNRIVSRVRERAPSIVHLHWVANSFVRPEDVPRFGLPIVWTLRDMWPFTGGCHYSGRCERYRESCGRCPHLRSSMERDLSRWTWHRKTRAWRSVDIHPVGISKWIADEARSSALFGNRDVRVIENAIDVSYWHRVSMGAARKSFGLPPHKRVILFIALNLDERHKGFAEFREAVRLLAETRGDDYHALVVGAGPANGDRALGITATFTGRLDDDLAVRDAYSVADVTVLPSSAEAFGKAAAESLACGTPCVVFDGTGLADVVSHQQSGYVARQGDLAALAAGVEWVLESPDRWLHLSRAGRDAATTRFSVATQARAYVDLYTEIAGLRGRQEAR